MTKLFAVFAGLFGLLGVALGAFGAHGLKEHVAPYQLEVWQQAVQYQMFHGLALLAVFLLLRQSKGRLLNLTAACFILGTALFSGSLYGLVLGAPKVVAFVTPLGGLLLLTGWLLFTAGLYNVAGDEVGEEKQG